MATYKLLYIFLAYKTSIIIKFGIKDTKIQILIKSKTKFIIKNYFSRGLKVMKHGVHILLCCQPLKKAVQVVHFRYMLSVKEDWCVRNVEIMIKNVNFCFVLLEY